MDHRGPDDDGGCAPDHGGFKYAKVGDRANIIDEGDNRFVRINFPQGEAGTSAGGSLWQVELEDNAADELYVSYRVRFVGSDFDFVKGGKLLGLSGGNDNTGGETPNGIDGWSGRIMWRAERRHRRIVDRRSERAQPDRHSLPRHRRLQRRHLLVRPSSAAAARSGLRPRMRSSTRRRHHLPLPHHPLTKPDAIPAGMRPRGG